MDPGDHLVEATQAGRKPFRKTVSPNPTGGAEKIDITELPEIEYGAPHEEGTTPPPVDNNPPPVDNNPPPQKEEPKKGGVNPLMIGGIAALGVGVGGVVVGVIMGVSSSGDASSRDKLCPPKAMTPCRSQAAFDLDYNAHVEQSMMFLFGGVGAALVITGGVLLGLSFAKKSSAPQTTGLVVAPAVGPQLTGLQLGGTF
jgi:hypothetical protein